MRVTNPETLAIIDDLQNRYISALDNKDIKTWSTLFAQRDDATYICRSAENESRNLPIALMLDDCLARIKDRVIFITQIWKGTFQDYRTRHFIQRVACEDLGDGLYSVKTNFSIEYTLDPHPSKTLAAGVYEDLISLAGDEPEFVSKKAIYDTTVLPQYIVYPF
jgi:3-phenylpropionate/cinnamic acid dioxygenase small subunit